MSSKIKVDTIENVAGSGNVSLGSGHNLVVPGDLTVDTSTLKVDSSNNKVGIGETSPLGKLHIKSGDSGASSVNANANELVIENSDYTGITILGENESNICFGDNEDPDVGRIEYHHSDNSMRFRTNASDRMTINDSGYVTIPNQPFVRLKLSSHINSSGSTVNSPGNQVTGFTVMENVGSHWNSSNNNFTCPVAGVYQVSVFFIKYPHSGAAHVDLHKNGSYINAIRWRGHEGGTSYHQVAGTASVTCAANDVLDWHYFGGAGVHDENGSWEIKLSH